MSGYTERHTLGASPVAQLIADIARELPRETQLQLRRMVASTVASPRSSELRDARLGLLAEMIHKLDDPYPDPTVYEVEQAARRAAGELWPARSTLTELFHHWFKACDAARRLAEGERQGRRARRVEADTSPAKAEEPLWTPEEAVHSLVRFHAKYGTWPSYTESNHWARISRYARSYRGPRNASADVLVGLFGTHDDAVRRAQRRWREIHERVGLRGSSETQLC